MTDKELIASLLTKIEALKAEARSVMDITEPYTCERDYKAGETIPLRIPKRFLPASIDDTRLQRIAAVLTRELPPWEFDGTEPICRDLLDAANGSVFSVWQR